MRLHRRPRQLYETGTEPDVRFSFANERTFLAWCRTALAMTAAGLALESFEVAVTPALRVAASGVLLVAGAALPVLAWREWIASEHALRQLAPLRRTRIGSWLAVAVSGASVLILAGAILRGQ